MTTKKTLSKFLLILLIFGQLSIANLATAAEIINEGFDNGVSAPLGWNMNVSGTYETAANSGLAIPSVKFGNSGDYIETPLFSNAYAFSFWHKGVSISLSSTLLIEGFDGTTWQTLYSLSNIGNSAEIKNYDLASEIIKLRFSYTKDAGNLAFDDLIVFGNPSANPEDLSATVGVTIIEETVEVTEISPVGAKINFVVNDNAKAKIKYGLSDVYGQVSNEIEVTANVGASINLSGLVCDSLYHYVVEASSLSNPSQTDISSNKTFSTGVCGIELNDLSVVSGQAKAKNNFENGWQWNFDLTVWNPNETNLQMKFGQWKNLADNSKTIDSATNIRFSLDNGSTWHNINANDVYSAGVDISGIDSGGLADGRQVNIIVQMKIPNNASAGDYGTSYGIKIE